MKFKITPQIMEQVEKGEEVLLTPIIEHVEQVKHSEQKEVNNKNKKDDNNEELSIVDSLLNVFQDLIDANSEAEYEIIASDNDVIDFIKKIQCLRLWLDLRDYIDEVYGERCYYLEWSYFFDHDRIRIVDINGYDNKEKRIEVTPQDVILEIKWLEEINMDMLYAYRIRYWLRSDMNLIPQ